MRITLLPSPNKNKRPPGTKVSLIVLHSTGGSFEGDLATLRSKKAKVSSHYLIAKSGLIVKLVATGERAWHAGKSAWRSGRDVNNFSVGIEQTHVDGRDPWPEVQVEACAELCALLCQQYDLDPRTDIIGHSDVALPRGRKVDPVGYPWPAFRAAVTKRMGG